MLFFRFSASEVSFKTSSPMSLLRGIARMASACASVKSNPLASFLEASDLNLISAILPFTRQSFACFIDSEPLSTSIIRSITSTALMRPSTTSALALAFSSK